MAHKLQKYVRSRTVVLHEDETGYSAARAMKENNIGCVLVCNEQGKLVGLVTDRDLILRVVCERRSSETELKYLMTPDPAVLEPEQKLDDAIWLMKSLGVRRLPLLGPKHKPVGVLALDDLLTEGSVPAREVSEIVRR